MTTPYATIIQNGDGATIEFNVTFNFIERDHVKVYRVVAATGLETELTVISSGNPGADEFIWLTNGRISVGTAPSTAEQLKIVRDTPENEQIVQWSDGSYIIAADLNQSDLQWLYGLQELEDKFSSLSRAAIKYLGAIDLTTDPAPASPAGGDFYINVGAGQVLGSWAGIAGQNVVGSEQVVYNSGLAEWQIFEVPSSQTGVLQVSSTTPITVDNTDIQRPVVGITNATSLVDGAMSAADKAKLDGVENGAEVNINADWNAVSGDAEILNKPSVIDGDAPADGKTYGRKDAAWAEVVPGGVTSIIAGAGISVDQSVGDVTITNTGGGNGVVSYDIYGTAKVQASVAANGTYSGAVGVADVQKLGGNGNYRILFQTPFADTDYQVVFGQTSITISWSNKTVSSVDVRTRSQSPPVETNQPFDISIFDNQPEVITSGTGTAATTQLYGTAKAAGSVNGDGTKEFDAVNFGSSNRISAGVYEVVFTTPLASDNYVVNVTSSAPNDPFTNFCSYDLTTTGFKVSGVDVSASPSTPRDSAFDFTVVDNTAAEVSLTTSGDVINIDYSGASAWGSVDAAGNLLAGLNTALTDFDGSNIYTITFSNPMPNADYSVTTGAGRQADTASFALANVYDKTPTGFSVQTYNYNGAATQGAFSYAVNALDALPPRGQAGADAWASVSSSGQINSSFNIQDVNQQTDGNYLVEFTVPMPDAKYAVNATGNGSSYYDCFVYNRTPTGFMLGTRDASGNAGPSAFSCVINATNATLPLSFTSDQIEAAINNPGASAWGDVVAESVNGPVGFTGMNVGSATRTGKGSYDVTFATPMGSSDYSIQITASQAPGVNVLAEYTNQTPNGFTAILLSHVVNDTADSDFSFTVHATNALPPKGGTAADHWCTINGNGFNIAEVRQGTGGSLNNYFVTFVTPLPGDYAVVATVNTALEGYCFIRDKSSTGYTVVVRDTDGAPAALSWSAVAHATNATLPSTFTESQIQSVIDLATGGGIDSSLLPLKVAIESLDRRIAAIEGEMTGDKR